MMFKSSSKGRGRDIWSRMPLEELVTAIASLKDGVSKLRGESWRLNKGTQSSNSLWAEVIQKLRLHHTKPIRQSLYKIWRLKRHNIDKLVEEQLL